MNHKWSRIHVPDEYFEQNNTSTPRHYMELFAVLCIETSHYVAFVKCGMGPDTPWCFFDSMADRKGKFLSHLFLFPVILISSCEVKGNNFEQLQSNLHN